MMGFLRKVFVMSAVLLYLMVAAIGVSQPAGAAASCSASGTGILNIPNAPTCPSNMQGADIWNGIVLPYVLWGLEVAMFAVGFLAIIFVIWGGFQYITSTGDPGKATTGQQTLVRALTGLGIALVARAGLDYVSTQISGGAISTTGASGTIPTTILNMGSILNLVYFIAGALAVVMIIFAGIQWITSSGNPSKATKARQTVTYAIIGLAVIILAYAITQFVSDKIGTGDAKTILGNITSAMFYVAGVLAVLMIIYSGIHYVSSMGNPNEVTKAKNTLMYSVIGLVVAILAYAIIGFVVSRLR